MDYFDRNIFHDPEWVRPPKSGQTIEGCSRAYLYELIKDGTIRSVALRPTTSFSVLWIASPNMQQRNATLEIRK
jgi:hypothetical protein